MSNDGERGNVGKVEGDLNSRYTEPPIQIISSLLFGQFPYFVSFIINLFIWKAETQREGQRDVKNSR